MSPLTLRQLAWNSECQTLSKFLDAKPSFRSALADLRQYHELTDFLHDSRADFESHRFWRPDNQLSLLGFAIERRSQRFYLKDRKRPSGGASASFGDCPLDPINVFLQQSGKQFPYRRSINGKPYNWLVQLQSFGEEHFTIASANCEPQDWRPDVNILHGRMVDAYNIAALLSCLVLYNGDGAGDSIPDWFHLHGLRAPDDPLPIQQAFALAPRSEGPVLRIAEPHWPLPAFRIAGSAEVIAAEVVKLAKRCADAAGEHATESIAMYMQDGAVVCIYVPRDRRREYVEEFGAKLGAFETAIGALVFSAPDKCAKLREGQMSFNDMWAMLHGACPEWSDEI